MAYRLTDNTRIRHGIRRIAREQIDKAIAEIDDSDLGDHETVHQVRKRCKKIRGLVRLVRPRLGDQYKRENAWYRDAARRLSHIRDAHSVVECLDQLIAHFETPIDEEAFDTIRERLLSRRSDIARDEDDLRQRLEEFRAKMCAGRERVSDWHVDTHGFDAVEGGLLKTYSRARRAMEAAYAAPDTEQFHEWRKRVKYHWYHLRLLVSAWESGLGAAAGTADELSDHLGDDHDLSTLRATLLADAERMGGTAIVQAAVGLISRRQEELRIRARPLGARLFGEKPEAFGSRLRNYWEAWGLESEITPAAVYRPDLVTV